MQSTRESQIIGVSEGAATRANSADADVRPGSITASIINGADVHADRSAGETGHSQAVLAVLGLLAALPVSAALANNHEADSGTSDAFSASLLGENDPVLKKIDAGFQTKKITRKHVTYGVPSIAETSANYFPVNAKTEVSPVRQLALDDGQGNKITVYLTEVSKKETNLYFEPTKFDVVTIEGINAKGEKVLNTYEYFMFVRVTEKGQLVLTYRLASAQANASPTVSTFMEVVLNISIDLKPGDSNAVISRKIQEALQKSNKVDVTKDRLQILSGGAQFISLNNMDGMILTHALRQDEEIIVLMNNMGSNARLLSLLQSGDVTANVMQQSLTPTAPKAPTPQAPKPTEAKPTVLPTATKENKPIVNPTTIKGEKINLPLYLPEQTLLNNAATYRSLTKEVKIADLSFEAYANISRADGSVIVFAREKQTGKLLLATRFNSEKNEYVWKIAGLGDFGDAQGISIGIAVHNRDGKLSSKKDIEVILREASVIVPEEATEMRYTNPLGVMYFARLDELLSNKDFKEYPVKGHVLLETARDRLPNWLNKEISQAYDKLKNNPNNIQTKQEIRNRFIEIGTTNIHGMMEHGKGRITTWNLFNETLPATNQSPRDSNFWKDLVGNDYVEVFYNEARKTDPNVKLMMNDWGNDGPAFYEAQYQQIATLKQSGVVFDGVGIQFHTSINETRYGKDYLKSVFKRYAQLGIKFIEITEMDTMHVLNLPYDLERQANIYQMLFDAAIETNKELGYPFVRNVTFWGYKDSDTWLSTEVPKAAGKPLLFDENLNPKLNYIRIRDDLESRLVVK